LIELLALARSPRLGSLVVLARGTPLVAIVLVLLSTAIALVEAARFAEAVPVDSVVFGEGRSAAVTALINTFGRDTAALVVYLFQQSYGWLIVATGLTPLFIWILGSTAVQAAARLGGARAPFVPMLVLFGYATGLTRIPADLFGLVLPGSGLAQLVGTATLLWLAIIVLRAIEAHYAMLGGRALTTLIVAAVFFYLVPLALIVLAAVAIIIAAIVLDYAH
jgi:hypothetical protein